MLCFAGTSACLVRKDAFWYPETGSACEQHNPCLFVIRKRTEWSDVLESGLLQDGLPVAPMEERMIRAQVLIAQSPPPFRRTEDQIQPGRGSFFLQQDQQSIRRQQFSYVSKRLPQ